MQELLKKQNNKSFFCYLITIFVTSVTIYFVYHLWNTNLLVYPLAYTGDGLASLVGTKRLILEGGLGYTSSLLGAPFGTAEYDFLQNSYVPVLLKKFLSLFTTNYVLVYNLSCLLGYVIISCVSLYVLKKLDVDERVAVVLSVLFACTPYHFFRAFNHYSLGFYVSIPVAVYYIVRMMHGSILDEKRHYINWNNFKYLMAMVLLATCGVYYAFFACFFLCVAGIYVLINDRKIKRLGEIVLSIVLIFCNTIIGYLPTIIYKMINGENTSAVIRLAEEIQQYSLRISQLVLPLTGHRISFLASLKSTYNSMYTSNENDSSTLGLVFLIGFVILLLFLWKKKNENEKNKYLQELACLNLSALLYASTGGLILVQGMFSLMIRCSNRISIFISFFSCICVGIVLSNFIRKKHRNQCLIAIVLAGILFIGIFDQTKAGGYVDYASIKSSVDSDKAFVEEIENMEEEDSMILQLPIAEYPEGGIINNMTDYAQLVGYLYSDTLRWSYGVYKGRTGSDFYGVLKSSDTSAMEIIETAAAMGYTGIYIDVKGYTTDKLSDLREQLCTILEEEPLVSINEDKLYFSLTNYIEQNQIEVTYCNFEFTEGIYSKEESGESAFRWMEEDGKFRIYSWSEDVRQVSLILTVASTWEEDYSLTLSVGDAEETYVIHNGDNQCVFEIILEHGYNTVSFTTDAPAVESDDDSKNMHLKLTEYSIQEVTE